MGTTDNSISLLLPWQSNIHKLVFLEIRVYFTIKVFQILTQKLTSGRKLKEKHKHNCQHILFMNFHSYAAIILNILFYIKNKDFKDKFSCAIPAGPASSHSLSFNLQFGTTARSCTWGNNWVASENLTGTECSGASSYVHS